MASRKIDVKSLGNPFNLGVVDEWSKEDVDFLLSQGATINAVNYIHIPLAKIEGDVLLGIGQKPPPGPPAELFIGARKIKRAGNGRRWLEG